MAKLLLHAIARPDLSLPRLLAALSGALLIVAYPKPDLSAVAWFAVIPLFLAARGRGARDGFWLGWLAGLVFFVGTFYWLWHVTIPGWILLAMYLAVYPGLWGAAVAAATRRFDSGGVGANFALMILLPAAWVLQEWLRAHVISGFPWNMLGASQHANSGVALGVAQIAEFTGVYGVSFLVCLFNVAVVLTADRFRRDRGFGRRPHVEIFAALILVLLCWRFGANRVMQYRPGDGTLTVALIQPNIPQEVKEDPKLGELSRKRLRELTDLAVAKSKPRLILWPETATPEYFRWDKECYAIITNVVTRTGAYLLTGSMDLDGHENPKTARAYNSVFMVQPNLHIQKPYWKIHLVPFGEFVPLERWLPFMKYVTPIPGSFDAGSEYTMLHLHDPPLKLAPLICFEDTFPYLARAYARRGADLLVNVTNDAWFKESAGAIQHAANAVFRAIETRMPLLRCANNGLSGYIDPVGRVADYIHGDAREGIFVTAWKTLNVPVPRAGSRPLTFYTRYGDVFALACIGLTVLWAAAEIGARLLKRRLTRNA
ncbi:MAG: apolipoprotein N-acyltransferase [Verrucomicrobiae bacterium]|nr:apolipoprotein N-acyltransferase [Verrucomicrobiae bacterium]